MVQVDVFLADGMEEVECLAVVDVLRRAKFSVKMISISDTKEVTGSHRITVSADSVIEEEDLSDADLLFLPGGLPGTTNLSKNKKLFAALSEQIRSGKRVAAICAAPSILGKEGLLKGKRATCYPGFEDTLTGALYMPHEAVVTDGLITTAHGMGCAVDLGLELVRLFTDKETADALRKNIQYPGTF